MDEIGDLPLDNGMREVVGGGREQTRGINRCLLALFGNSLDYARSQIRWLCLATALIAYRHLD